MKAPCYNCEKRHEKCHNICSDYKNWQVEQYAIKNRIKLEDALRGYTIHAQQRMKKRGD